MGQAKPSSNLMRLLVNAQQGNESSETTSDLWPQVVAMCEKDPHCAQFQSPKSKSTPLHLACSLVDLRESPDEVVSAIRALIQANPEAVSVKNGQGYIPLHYVLAPAKAAMQETPRWNSRAAVIRLMVASDYESSLEYLSRNDVVFEDAPALGPCTPLYRALESFPDDFDSPGPTVDFISALQESAPQMVSIGNANDGDKPLALLYRRFTRQFDISEKFFAGDNSRPQVVEHRRKYKLAAGNTWKIIELLLRPESTSSDDSASQSREWFIVHRAIQVDTPPDLLRYIVETNSEELAKVDEHGNLPLHYAAKSQPPKGDKRACFPEFHTKYVVDELLYKFPEGAAMQDAQGNFPLTLAVNSGKQWIGGGVKSLYDAHPEALKQIDLSSHKSLQNALSFDPTDGIMEEAKTGIVKDEHHDAIMLVQRPDVDIIEVVTSMWAHEEDAGVQMLGSLAISKMASKAEGAEVLRLSLSAVAAVVNAMKAHPNEAIVQEKACCALKLLSGSDGKREVSFVASGAIAAIVGAMQAHVGDNAVQEEACAAIADIVSVGGDDRATIVASVSGFTAIVNALAAHPDSVNVQKEGCRALCVVTEYPDANLPELPRSQTESLIEAAKEKFPLACEKNADLLLSRLS